MYSYKTMYIRITFLVIKQVMAIKGPISSEALRAGSLMKVFKTVILLRQYLLKPVSK